MLRSKGYNQAYQGRQQEATYPRGSSGYSGGKRSKTDTDKRQRPLRSKAEASKGYRSRAMDNPLRVGVVLSYKVIRCTFIDGARLSAGNPMIAI